MNPSTAGVGNSHAPLCEAYTDQLREHALVLLWMGYQRMKPESFAREQEDSITGELVREINEAMQDLAAPEWVQHYSVPDQVRLNVPGVLGKSRPIVDIEFERHKQGRRPRLRFEAKRLGPGHGTGKYLGREGLGAFIKRDYPTTHGESGMLGYVQQHTEDRWAGVIARKLTDSARNYRVIQEGGWARCNRANPPDHAYRTIHMDSVNKQLAVLHVLLRFY